MNNKQSWEHNIEDFLKRSAPSADTRVLAKALAKSDPSYPDTHAYQQDLADVERALHIEQHIDEIGLQPMPSDLQDKLKVIGKKPADTKVVWYKFVSQWPKASALAASVALLALLFGLPLITSPPQPTYAQIKQAEQELKLAFEYLSIAQVKSSDKIKKTLNEHVQDPLEQSVLTPIEYIKESS